ncbi:MAG: hypothetical protein LBT26_08010 [Clostridiales Family XIII bacterium]|jgi:hypothetical protein|nr:hypothetical protein [Clostridiales Family XIII bacterium]
MKRLGALLCLVLLTLLSPAAVFAAELTLVDNYPKEGSHSSPPQNLGIKLFFDRAIADAAENIREQNENCFTMTDPDGVQVPLQVLYTEKDPQYILVVAEPEDAKIGLGSDTEYTFTISEKLLSSDGTALGAPETITFRTRNTSVDMNVNMVLMGVMFVGMLVFSSMSMRRQAKKASAAESREKMNPYKIAKETGKSVEEIIEREAKRKQKEAKRQDGAAKAGAKPGAAQEKTAAKGRRVKRVKGPRPIAAAGSAYRTGRKAAAERRVREAAERMARGTTNPKQASRKTRKKN